MFFGILVIASILCLANAKHVDPKGSCSAYGNLMHAIITLEEQQCKPLDSAIPDGETGCALRDRLRAEVKADMCYYGPDGLEWVQDDYTVNWEDIHELMKKIQIGMELKYAVEFCQMKTDLVRQDELEKQTKELLEIEDSDDGEQEACWDDALGEVKELTATNCLYNFIFSCYVDLCWN